MTLSAAPPRALARALAAAATLLVLAAPARAEAPEAANFDARAADPAQPSAGAERAREALRERLGRFAAVSVDERAGTLRSVGRLDGFLTGPSGRPGADVALDFVRAHVDAFGIDAADLDGLRLERSTTAAGIEHLSWEQRHRGVPVADAVLRAAVTASGRLLSVTGPPAADVAIRSVEPRVSAASGYAAASRGAGDPQPDAAVAQRDGGAERSTRFSDGGRASLALYRSGAGYRLAWRVLAPVSSTAVYDVLVDARSGRPMRRINRVNQAVPANVFKYTPDDNAQLSGANAVDFTPWLSSSAKLQGPNAHAFLDLHDVVGPQPDGAFQLTPEAGSDIAQESGGYRFPLTPVAHYPDDGCPDAFAAFPTSACTWNPSVFSSGTVNRKQSATQLFYLVNLFHDHLRDDPDIAFAAGGFRATGQPQGDPNTGAAPGASDPVLAQALDGADTNAGFPDADHVNNANFLTLPDGYPGLMQMYLWKPPLFGGYDGANDASIVFHEYTHGLSNRLVTDAAGFGALGSAQAGAMGEGWSDFYAMDYLDAVGLHMDVPGSREMRLGRYLDNADTDAVGSLIRYQSLDCLPSSPDDDACRAAPGPALGGGFTYADFGRIDAGGPEVHRDGEIWGQTLWSIRTALTTQYGDAAGIARSRRYVTQAMRLSPAEPSFLDMRNAMLEASPDADDDVLWTAFAARGMGYFAATDGADDIEPVADFTDPATLTGAATLTGTVTDQDARSVAGATVGVAGFDGGLGPQKTTQTQADGSYALTAIPTSPGGSSTYPAFRARKAAYAEDRANSVVLTDNTTTTVSFQIERDWSSAAGGATVEQVTGPDNTNSGCGPGGLIDDEPGVVWGSSNAPGGQRIVIDLGAPVDLARVAIDPAAGCGDDASAALGGYELRGATGPNGPFVGLGSPDTFAPADNGALATAFAGVSPRIRYLALHAYSPQSSAPGGSGEDYLDVAELHVAKTPGSALGPTVETATADAVSVSGATLTGAVTAHDGATEVYFEYGTTASYGATVAAGALGAGTTATPVAAAVTGLQPSTVYHFRALALRAGQGYPGADATFATGPATAPPTPTPNPGPTPQPATPTVLRDSRLTATRKGMLKVRVRFSAAAPPGSARLSVSSGKRRYAVALLTVRPGRTVTKTLRLNKAGRRAIRPGKSRRVTVELRLPGGKKVKKTLTLARKRR